MPLQSSNELKNKYTELIGVIEDRIHPAVQSRNFGLRLCKLGSDDECRLAYPRRIQILILMRADLPLSQQFVTVLWQ